MISEIPTSFTSVSSQTGPSKRKMSRSSNLDQIHVDRHGDHGFCQSLTSLEFSEIGIGSSKACQRSFFISRGNDQVRCVLLWISVRKARFTSEEDPNNLPGLNSANIIPLSHGYKIYPTDRPTFTLRREVSRHQRIHRPKWSHNSPC